MPARPPPRQAPRGPGVARPRGPLPARVYWVRRVLALSMVAALVVGVVGLVQLLTPSSGGDGDRAQVASASTDGERPAAGAGAAGSSTEPSTEPSSPAPTGKDGKDGKGGEKKPAKPPPATPDGPCADSDVVVTPVVKQAVGGSPITIRLRLTTVEDEACWWQVSPSTVTMRITSGDDEIWTSRQCPATIPDRAVPVRRDRVTRVDVPWSAKRSDEGCTDLTQWALPGFYHVEAAAFAGEPREEQFEVTAPKAPVVKRTAEPEPTTGASPGEKPTPQLGGGQGGGQDDSGG